MTCVWLIRHLTTAVHLWQKTMAVFDMCMSMCVHLRSWSTAPLISGFKVSKQIVFGMGSLGWISSWRKSEQKKKENQIHARLKTGCTDRESRETSIPPSPRAPRPRGRERMGVPSLGFMDIRGIWRKWKEQKRTNQKNRKLKEKRGNRKRAKKTGNGKPANKN